MNDNQVPTTEELAALVARMDFTRFPIPVEIVAIADGKIQLKLYARDRDDPRRVNFTGRLLTFTWGQDTPRLSREITVFEEVLRGLRYVLDHEVRECFLVDGKPFDDPHKARRPSGGDERGTE